MEFLGNENILTLSKTAFLCSRKVPASAVLRCYAWAIGERDAGNCIIGGFHSQLEKDVLHYLLNGTQPIIVALARGLKERIEKELIKPLDEGRLLIITPFDKNVKRVNQYSANRRNKMMIEIAEFITVGFASEGGNLESLLQQTSKPVTRLV
ncbi:MAG: DNA-binding protein [Ignavibacteriales bacterium]|nr:DNA-binding protein [Ignavibacteriales bacterium]MCF8306821.1 DNA-binding protein [Ignavibacteriales bacterium]MCF8316776.1 DNA-binding protein [Ignavibacteriales bacterium]MCF8438080.1 DNA-binding protein [Ignavibacteriales bacterium]